MPNFSHFPMVIIITSSAQTYSRHSGTSVRPCKCHVAGCQAGRRVYVHCTAGLGRAPAACIAYLYWCSDDAALRDGDVWSLDKVGARLPLAGATHLCRALGRFKGLPEVLSRGRGTGRVGGA